MEQAQQAAMMAVVKVTHKLMDCLRPADMVIWLAALEVERQKGAVTL
jgi:hypothetical protein